MHTIIVGAGVVGAATAASLAGPGVLVLEQGASPGEEATAQNAGMQRRLVVDAPERALACRSLELLQGWAREGLFPDGSPLRPTGGVIGVVGDGPRAAALAAAAEDLQARGVAADALDADAAARIAPALAGAPLHRAWSVPGDGLIDAHQLTQAALRRARAGGVALRVGARVVGLLVEGGRVRGVRFEEETLLASRVVLAAGAWGAWLAASAGLARPLVPLARHLLLSAPHALAGSDHPYVWLDDAGLYVRPEAGGWLMSPCDETPVAPPSGPGSRGPVDPAARAMASDRLAERLPALAGVRLGVGWTGLRTFAPDRRPLIGADPEVEGLWWAGALGGAGVSCALAVGEALAELMGGRAPPGARAFDPGRVWGEDRLPAGALAVLPCVNR